VGSVSRTTFRDGPPAVSRKNSGASARRLHRAGARGFFLVLLLSLFSITTVLTPAYAAGPLIVAARAVTWAAPAVIDLVMPSQTTIDNDTMQLERLANGGGGFFGPGGGSYGGGGGGGGDNTPTAQSPSAKKRPGKASALFELLGALAGTAAIEGWFSFGSETPANYADPAPANAQNGPGSTFTAGRATLTMGASAVNCVTLGVTCHGGSADGLGYRFDWTRSATMVSPNRVRIQAFHTDGSSKGTVATLTDSFPTPFYLGATHSTNSSLKVAVYRFYDENVTTLLAEAYINPQSGTPTVPTGSTVVTNTGVSECKNISTGAVRTVTGTPSAGYRYSDGRGQFVIPACNTGEVRTSARVDAKASDGRTVKSPIPAVSSPITPSGYSQCQPTGNCQLVLTRHASGTGEQVGSTLTDIALFREWLTQSSPNTGAGTRTVTEPDGSQANQPRRSYPDGSTVECRFGPYLVSYSQCESIPTEPTGPDAPTRSDNCVTDFSWNPISWVLEPVKCALHWAFVPSTAVAQGWTTRINNIKTRFPVNIMVGGYGFITDVLGVVDNTNETFCDFSFDTPQGVEFDPVCSAAETAQTNAKGTAIYRLAQIGIIGTFVWWAWRRIAASFGGKESTDA
jgi:hypothetical protein